MLLEPAIRVGVVLTLLALPPLPGLAATASAEPPLRVAAFGDSGASDRARRVVDAALAQGAEAYLGLGDYAYNYPPSRWIDMIRPLTAKGVWLVPGNHDQVEDYEGVSPLGVTNWSVELEGVRMIGLNTEETLAPGNAQFAWLEGELQRESPEFMKLLVLHVPWWLKEGARHPAAAFPGDPEAMDGLVRTHGVDLVIAAHEHNYHRAERNGDVQYLIVGSGGRRPYPVAGEANGTVATCACWGAVVMDLTADQVEGRFVSAENETLDAFAADRLGRPSDEAGPDPAEDGLQEVIRETHAVPSPSTILAILAAAAAGALKLRFARRLERPGGKAAS